MFFLQKECLSSLRHFSRSPSSSGAVQHSASTPSGCGVFAPKTRCIVAFASAARDAGAAGPSMAAFRRLESLEAEAA